LIRAQQKHTCKPDTKTTHNASPAADHFRNATKATQNSPFLPCCRVSLSLIVMQTAVNFFQVTLSQMENFFKAISALKKPSINCYNYFSSWNY